MTGFNISNLQDASILALNDMKDVIQIDPVYQRVGGVWSKSKKKLFIDSLINKYDVPKFYFHLLTGKFSHATYQYSIVDGRQRLEAIWEFIAGEYPLASDFVFLEDPGMDVANLTFREMSEKFPRLATRFNARSLSVMVIQSDDIDFVEDMFSRLNEAVPLNAAEKRNAFPGPLPAIARSIAKHHFFADRIPIPASRYRHYDLASKLLYLQRHLKDGNFVDTKKASLDAFFRAAKLRSPADYVDDQKAVTEVLDLMDKTFVARDELLKSTGMVAVYYSLFSKLRDEKKADLINRKSIYNFERLREINRERFENEEDGVEFKLIEFDELAQSSNDAASIKARFDTLRAALNI